MISLKITEEDIVSRHSIRIFPADDAGVFQAEIPPQYREKFPEGMELVVSPGLSGNVNICTPTQWEAFAGTVMGQMPRSRSVRLLMAAASCSFVEKGCIAIPEALAEGMRLGTDAEFLEVGQEERYYMIRRR